jgi:sigma-E factor negative regulatory protein RseA
MSEDKLKQLSSFMDSELEQSLDPLLDAVKSDTALQGAWRRYHLIGDCLRGHLPEQINLDLSRDIRAAIEREPAILSPQRPRTARLPSLLLKPAAGLAIAASVAVVAVISFQSLGPIGTGTQEMTGPTLAVSTAPEPAVQYATERPPAPARMVSGESRQVAPQQGQMDSQYRFNSYLLNHSEYRANTGVQGFTPYVRIVTHDRQE